MSTDLTLEEEMRRALGLTSSDNQAPAPQKIETTGTLPRQPAPEPIRKTKSKSHIPKLRVTLIVSKVFEGEESTFVHDTSTLSTILAEQEAKTAAKAEKFQFFRLQSIKPKPVE